MRTFKFLNNLIHTWRYSGCQLLVNESVSDHIMGMNELAVELVDSMNINSPLDKKELLKDLIYRNSIHDFGESLYCDIPRTFKYYNEEIGNIINKVEHELVNKKLPKWLAFDIESAKSKDPHDFRGFIISVLDTTQAGIKMKSEIELGNRYFKDEIFNAIEVLKTYRNKLAQLTSNIADWTESSQIPVDHYFKLITFIDNYIEYMRES